MNLAEFCETPFFTAIEMLIVIFSTHLITMTLAHRRNSQSNPDILKAKGIFRRTKYWIKHINRFPRPAIDIRRSWAIKRAEKPVKAGGPPANPFLGMLGMIAGFAPTILVNMRLSGKPALVCPFIIPQPLRSLLQYGLSAEVGSDNRIISAFGLFFLLNTCIELFVEVIPMPSKREAAVDPSGNYKNSADLLLTEPHKWELENAEEELLAMIDAKLAKK